MFLHVIDAKYVEAYKLQMKFNNRTEWIVDLENELYGEVFEPLKDLALFKKFELTGRTIEWPNGADFAPEYLIEIAELSSEPQANELVDQEAVYV